MKTAIFGLIGVVVGAALTTAKDWWFDRRHRKKELEYLCIRVAILFDYFISDCVEVVHDDGPPDGSRDEHGYKLPQVNLPNLDLKSMDVEWKSLPAKLMYEVLTFPTLINEANEYILSKDEYEATPPDFEALFEARALKFSELGLRAIELSSKLRKISDLPDIPHIPQGYKHRKNWSPTALFTQTKTEIEEAQLQRVERVRARREQERVRRIARKKSTEVDS